MGILDSVRGRLGLGDRRDGYDDGDYQEYDDVDYQDGQYAALDDGLDNGYDADYSDYDAPGAMTGFGVDRADYYNDNHAPLVSLSDVRSHQPQAQAQAQARPRVPSRVPEQRHDRIPEPKAYRRQTNSYETAGLDEDALAFKDGLARSEVSSLQQLQQERLRLEDTGRFDKVTPITGYSSEPRLKNGRVRPRGTRRVDNLRPISYAEAEQVTKLLRNGSVVVLDLTQTRPELAKRILDFSFGVVSAFDGQVDRYADRVYILTAKTALTAEERASIRLGT
jgi:cell division inhibitor SepF